MEGKGSKVRASIHEGRGQGQIERSERMLETAQLHACGILFGFFVYYSACILFISIVLK